MREKAPRSDQDFSEKKPPTIPRILRSHKTSNENATQDDGTCQYQQDADGDGVPDGEDQCQGHDDSVDEDGNGVPDGCENQIIAYTECWI